MSGPNKRRTAARLDAFGEKSSLEQVADDIFGSSEETGFNTGRVVARPIDIDDIWADVRQPRRVIPASIRLLWNGSPADVPQLLDTWASVAANAAGRMINIQQIILGEGEGVDTDGTPVIYESFIALLRLAGSILRDGLINPITVIKQDSRYLIESGERRLMAYWLLRLHTQAGDEFARVPAVTASGADYIWRQAAENTARRSLNAVGMARQLALLIMAARGQDQYADYDEIIPPGGSDRRYYAQIADGNTHRIPKGAGERIQSAMGLSMEQLSQYRRLLRLTDDDEINDLLWLRGDIEDWPELMFRQTATLTVVKVREIVSRDNWSLDDFRNATLTPVKVQPPPPPPGESGGSSSAGGSSSSGTGTGGGSSSSGGSTGSGGEELARRILKDLRAGFNGAYALVNNRHPAASDIIDRATRFLNTAQVHYDNNRLVSAQTAIENAFAILREADSLPPSKQHPKPNTSDPYMQRIYNAWRSSFGKDDLLLITQDGEEYIAIHHDDNILRSLRRNIQPGSIGISGGADYTLVSKIDADLMAEVTGQYAGNTLAFSYADLDEDMQYVAGTAFRARNIPLNRLPPEQPDASDKTSSDGSQQIVEPGQKVYVLLKGLRDLASTQFNVDAVTAVDTLLMMTWDRGNELAQSGELGNTLGLCSDEINAAMTTWSETLTTFLSDLFEQISE